MDNGLIRNLSIVNLFDCIDFIGMIFKDDDF